MATFWRFKFPRVSTLALIVAFCFGMITMQLCMAQKQVETVMTEEEPRDMTEEDLHSVHIQFCVS